MGLVIGVDFDNTIVSYDNLLYKLAVEQDFIDLSMAKNKKLIRDEIRQLPNGEIEWQKLQALIYGSKMSEAELIEGVQPFFQHCKQYKIPIAIVSHKTEYSNFTKSCISLREAALAWMTAHRVFDSEGFDLTRTQVYFESTRLAKIERIQQLGCTHFIDDLEETFLEESFPIDVKKFLYMSSSIENISKNILNLPNVTVVSSWSQIPSLIFDNAIN